jgi:predicted MFS family arabinose efflux permease
MSSLGSGVAAPYRRLLAEPVLRRLAVADACARLPQAMLSITVLLTVALHASMTVAGLALAGYTLGQACTAPARGRLADRRGLFAVAAICAAGYAAALAGLLAASAARAPAAALIAAAAAAGLVTPPLSPGLRSLWSVHAAATLRQAAFALDAAVFDLAYITGPVLASALAIGIAPAAALGVLLLLTAVAVAAVSGPSGRAVAAAPSPELAGLAKVGAGPAAAGLTEVSSAPQAGEDGTGRRGRLRRPSWPGPLRSAGLRRLLLTAALVNAALSATEVGLTSYVRDHHALWASGPLLAGVSAGSILGSLLIGVRPLPGGPARRLTLLLAAYAAGLVALAAAGLYPPLLAVAAPLAGLCLGPTLATLFSAAGSAVPHGGTEAQAWLNSIMNGGAAAGAAAAGLTSAAPGLGLALAAAIAMAATASAAIASTRATPAVRPSG